MNSTPRRKASARPEAFSSRGSKNATVFAVAGPPLCGRLSFPRGATSERGNAHFHSRGIDQKGRGTSARNSVTSKAAARNYGPAGGGNFLARKNATYRESEYVYAHFPQSVSVAGRTPWKGVMAGATDGRFRSRRPIAKPPSLSLSLCTRASFTLASAFIRRR